MPVPKGYGYDEGWLEDIYWPHKARRVDLREDELYALLLTKGVRVLWESVAKCCCAPRGEGSQADCPVCNGRGRYVYQYQVIRALCIGIRSEAAGAATPVIPSGLASFTTRSEFGQAPWDRLTLLDARYTLSNRFTRDQAGHVFRLRYAVVPQEVEVEPIPPDVDDNAPGDPEASPPPSTILVDVMHMRTVGADGYPAMLLDGDGNPILDELGRPRPRLLVKGVDYDLTEDGHIDFTKGDELGTAPEHGKVFSIQYKTRPVYVVGEWPHLIRDTNAWFKSPKSEAKALFVQSVAKLEWMPDLWEASS